NNGALFSTTMLDQANFWRQNGTIDVNGITDKSLAARDGGGDDAARTTLYGDRTWRLWAAPAAGYANQKGDMAIGSASMSQRGYGLMAGLDYQDTSELLFGGAVYGSSTRFQVPDRSTTGTLNSGLIGAYAMYQSGQFYATGTLFGGFQSTQTNRVIAGVMPTAEFAQGRLNGGLLGARVEMGYKLKADMVSIVPFLAFQPAVYSQMRANENSQLGTGGQGYAGLSYASAMGRAVPLLIGAQFETEIVTRDGSVMVPFIRLAWMHDFTPSRRMNASFMTAPGFMFNVIGASQPRDALVARAGAQLKITDLMRVFGSFDGVFSGQGNSYAGTIGLQMGW
ncbi:MAG: autotransporter outer membrane beta-barrel domain-containing protein, partial [Beijerinckiaceae bacterium]|nr:autotransporter outer membrane beta-barrel domain-containing protein [Beijerinckiaceae bacterium]